MVFKGINPQGCLQAVPDTKTEGQPAFARERPYFADRFRLMPKPNIRYLPDTHPGNPLETLLYRELPTRGFGNVWL